MKVVSFPQGIAIHGTFPQTEVLAAIRSYLGEERVALSIVDPPYGGVVSNDWDHEIEDDRDFAAWMVDWTKAIGTLLHDNAALYVWGGTGKPRFRPFYRYLVDVEAAGTGFLLADHITWKKRRAYGIQWGYLYTREEVAYLIKGTNIKKPRKFSVPLLEEKRAYAGYNPKYPAKSDYYRRSNVWTDVTEILRGKTHVAQKPTRLFEIPIQAHTEPGEVVLDTFAGSGTLAKAAMNLGRRFIVVERDPLEFEKMVDGLQAHAREGHVPEGYWEKLGSTFDKLPSPSLRLPEMRLRDSDKSLTFGLFLLRISYLRITRRLKARRARPKAGAGGDGT